MPKFTERTLDDIRSRLRLSDIISSYTRLTKAGANYKGLCPFHKEKSPSFVVNEEKGLWHCFGCGAGGDIIGFVMKADRLTFPETVEELARKAGITLEVTTEKYDPSSSAPKISRKNILKLNELYTQYFQKLLFKEEGEPFLKYLESREVPLEIIKGHRLGASSSKYKDRAFKYFTQKKGIAPEILFNAGLAIRREDTPIDRFTERLMFPLFNAAGDVVGFAGRAMGDEMPKYLNSPQTTVFDKGKILYGLDKAKKDISDSTLILVEGYMDALSLYKVEIKNVIASMGTALSEQQVDLLRRYCTLVYLCYDSDIAGDAAAVRGIELLIVREMEIKVITLPEGEDPDSLVKKGGKDLFLSYLRNARPYFEFMLDRKIAQFGVDTPQGKKNIIVNTLPLIEKNPNPIEKDEQFRYLSNKLNVDVKKIIALKKSSVKYRSVDSSNTTATDSAADKIISETKPAENQLLKLLFSGTKNYDIILMSLKPPDFSQPDYIKLFTKILEFRMQKGRFNAQQFQDTIFEPSLLNLVSSFAIEYSDKNISEIDNETEIINSLIAAIKRDSRKRRLHELQVLIEEADKSGDKKLLERLAQEKTLLTKQGI